MQNTMQKCDRCNGEGIENNLRLCGKCFGVGELNWIEAIFGKSEKYFQEEIQDRITEVSDKYRFEILNLKTIFNLENDLNKVFENFKFKIKCSSIIESSKIEIRFVKKEVSIVNDNTE